MEKLVQRFTLARQYVTSGSQVNQVSLEPTAMSCDKAPAEVLPALVHEPNPSWEAGPDIF